MPLINTIDKEFLVIKYSDGSCRVEHLTHANIPCYQRCGYELLVWDSPFNIEHAKNYLKGNMTFKELCAKNILVSGICKGIENVEEEKT